jgi:hypothetical protein
MNLFRALFLASAAFGADCSPPADCPLFCRTEFGGLKNFYNSTDGDCYSIPKCLSGQYYDISANECYNQAAAPNITVNSSGPSNNTNLDKPTVCVNGYTMGNVCVCNTGYYTSNYQDPSSPQVYLCDTTTPQNSTYHQGPKGELYLQSQRQNPYLQVPLSPAYKIMTLLGVFFILCVISCCIVKRLKKNRPYRTPNVL